MTVLKIIQLNIRSFKANRYNLENILLELDPDIGLLSETWLKPGEIPKLKSYHNICHNHQDGFGGSGHFN